MNREHIENIGAEVVDSCVEVHRELGPGLFESTYQACLKKELELRGVASRCELELPVTYKGMMIDLGYRTDMIVDECVLVESKVVQKLLPIHEAQILSYLKHSGLKLGFLVNWNEKRIKDGIRRFVNGL
jgi:GxxExxY protein